MSEHVNRSHKIIRISAPLRFWMFNTAFRGQADLSTLLPLSLSQRQMYQWLCIYLFLFLIICHEHVCQLRNLNSNLGDYYYVHCWNQWHSWNYLIFCSVVLYIIKQVADDALYRIDFMMSPIVIKLISIPLTLNTDLNTGLLIRKPTHVKLNGKN